MTNKDDLVRQMVEVGKQLLAATTEPERAELRERLGQVVHAYLTQDR